MNLQNIRDQVNKSKIGVAIVQFPMTFIGKEEGTDLPIFKFGNGVNLPMTELGAGYISERFRQNTYAVCTRLFRDEKFEELAALTGSQYNPESKKYVAAFFNGAIVGIMSNYRPVPHGELLDKIQNAGLEDILSGWYLNQQELRVYLRLASTKSSGSLVYFRISNGHSGHSALKYYATIKVDNYEWGMPLTIRRRHLSRVNLAMESIKGALAEIQSLKIEDRLVSTKIKAVRDFFAGREMTVRQEALLLQVLDTKPANASEFVASMGVYASTVGYSSAVHGLLDPLVESIVKSAV